MERRALIIGGTGYLGTRIGRVLKSRYSVVLSGRDAARNQLAERATGCMVVTLDVTNTDSVREAFDAVRPDLVIHAAANKFVDVAEKEPIESVEVNLLGAENIARATIERNVATLIAVSSNAAAPPQLNVYGLAKAIMERMFCSLNGKTETKLASVRLGNIAWSTGSVLPIWEQMLAQGGVIGSTGPDRRRFFCSSDQAVALITTAIDHIDELAGKVLVPRLKQARIKDVLARFVEMNGGTWKLIDGRDGERDDEALIGDLEVPFTREVTFGGVPHYVISFNEKPADHLTAGVHARTAEALSSDEIATMIAKAPAGALGRP
jgi:UDP-glucose 4-epimerase